MKRDKKERSLCPAMKYFICVIGMVMIVEGLPYMTYPDWTKSCLRKILDAPSGALRLFGIAVVAIGLVLVYFGTK